MSLEIIIFILVIWSAIGFGSLLGMAANGEYIFGADGIEFVNPVFIYKKCRVNVFGAILVALLLSFICPLGAVGYWIYKLCTVGRKDEDFEDI